MKRLALLLLLLPLFALQWTVPVIQVLRGEAILRDGVSLRLALQPVDPYDVMRGRYLALSFPESNREHNLPDGMNAGDTLYVVLGADPDGIAHITRLSREPQESAFAWKIPASAKPGEKIRINIPLTRFYLPEEDAIAIDNTLRWRDDGERAQVAPTSSKDDTPRQRDEGERPQVVASLGVRIKDGTIVAESLWLNGQPYRDWLLTHGNREKK